MINKLKSIKIFHNSVFSVILLTIIFVSLGLKISEYTTNLMIFLYEHNSATTNDLTHIPLFAMAATFALLFIIGKLSHHTLLFKTHIERGIEFNHALEAGEFADVSDLLHFVIKYSVKSYISDIPIATGAANNIKARYYHFLYTRLHRKERTFQYIGNRQLLLDGTEFQAALDKRLLIDPCYIKLQKLKDQLELESNQRQEIQNELQETSTNLLNAKHEIERNETAIEQLTKLASGKQLNWQPSIENFIGYIARKIGTYGVVPKRDTTKEDLDRDGMMNRTVFKFCYAAIPKEFKEGGKHIK